MKIGFIGAGKVGFSLGKYFSVNGLDLSGYYSRNHSSAVEAAEFTGSNAYTTPEELIHDSTTIFITVPDGTITEIFNEIKGCDLTVKLICHCSGAMTAAEAFPDIASTGAKGLSIHPLFPVSSKYDSYKELSNAFFCLEGECADEWQELLTSIGNNVRIIDGNVKVRYHTACAISSNLVCALTAESIALLGKCGFTEEEALKALRPLAMSNMSKIFEAGLINALTGPVERNDISTVSKHLRCFDTEDEKQLYTAVSNKLIEVASLKHPETDYSVMRKLLADK
ncbi:Rossmann-like and DUF2520 domain-containing protein [Ruminococcus sp.]|uniref:Rossmann-like and DUF2520 domain-containing protein n=1 Tax=Ruminococcus sp. TaxID=41978 RepID=UPI0025F94917|nr:Rossmann-like and DUF2520 domain-containing protein [Ruminococcus sp.]